MNVRALLFLLPLMLVGCKVQLSTDVPISKLSEKGLRKIDANLFAEVPACSSFEDSRQPSNSVIRAQTEIPKIFDGAKYIECFTQKMNSFAHFVIPVDVGAITDESEFNARTIKIFSEPSSDTKLALHVPKEVKERLLNYNNSNVAGFIPEQTYISFNLINDTDKVFSFYADSAFVNGNPVSYSNFDIKNDGRVEVRLSNVQSAQAMLTKENSGRGVVYILTDKVE